MSIATAQAGRIRDMQRQAEERAEDLAWMAETGETLTGAAKRLGIGLNALEKWCRTHGEMAVYRRLAAREDLVPTYRPKACQRRRRAS